MNMHPEGLQPQPKVLRDSVLVGALFTGTLALVLRLAILAAGVGFVDDAYIYMRMARNFSEYGNFLFNQGDVVLTQTTALYVLLCGFVWKILGFYSFTVIGILAALADSGVAFLITVMAAHHDRSKVRGVNLFGLNAGTISGLMAGLFYACLSTTAVMAVMGMEVAFYALAIALTCRFLQIEKYNTAGFVSGMAVLIRPDGLILACVTFAYIFYIRKRIPWKSLGCFALIVVPYLILTFIYYGTIVPQSIVAKSLMQRSPLNELNFILSKFYLAPKAWIPGAVSLVGTFFIFRVDKRLLPLGIWAFAYVAALSLFARWWPWYIPPFAIYYVITIGIGMERILLWMFGKLNLQRFGRVIILGMLAFIALSLLVQSSMYASRHHATAKIYDEQRRKISAWINSNSPKNANVLIEPVGMVSFYTNRRFDDYPGLVSVRSTNALMRLKRKIGATPAEDSAAAAHLISSIYPDLLVLRESEYRLLKESDSLANYEVGYIHRIDKEVTLRQPDLQSMLVLSRRHSVGEPPNNLGSESPPQPPKKLDNP